MVAHFVQTRKTDLRFRWPRYRAGATLIANIEGYIRYVIQKPFHEGSERPGCATWVAAFDALSGVGWHAEARSATIDYRRLFRARNGPKAMAMSEKIHIRMYNVGFGDCFLLMLPEKKTILVDAGFHSLRERVSSAVTSWSIKSSNDLKQIQRESAPRCRRRHPHAPGPRLCFNSNEVDEFEVGEVWLPWVEDRANTAATRLWKKKQQFAKNLSAAMGFSASDQRQRKRSVHAVERRRGHTGTSGSGGWSNHGALDCLHEGFKRRDRPRPRFLPETETFPSTSKVRRCQGSRFASSVRRAIPT